jgi:hypothetical protein
MIYNDTGTPTESFGILDSTFSVSENYIKFILPDAKSNTISNWYIQGKIPYMRILSSATRDDYGNYSIESSTIIFTESFNTSPTEKIKWIPDATSPQLDGSPPASYTITDGLIYLKFNFNEYVDLSASFTDLSGICIQDSSNTVPTNTFYLSTACVVTTTATYATSVNINLPYSLHDTIWEWPTSDKYLSISTPTSIQDVSGNLFQDIASTQAVSILAEISSDTPTVAGIIPAEFAYNVNRSTQISVIFNTFLKPQDIPGCITATQITDSEGNTTAIGISGSIAYISAKKTVTFTPYEKLPGNVIIKIRVDKTRIKNFKGYQLEEDFLWTFKTTLANDEKNVIESPSSKITLIIPKNQLSEDGRIEFTESIPPNNPKKTSVFTLYNANTTENSWNNPYHYTFDDMTAEIIYFSDSDEFKIPSFSEKVKMTMDYSSCLMDDNPDYLQYENQPPVKESTLKIYYLNEETNMWIPINSEVDIENNTVSAHITHFSIYAIMGDQNFDLEDAHPYPVPYKPSEIPEAFKDTIRSGITFTNLPSECDIEIFTIAGRLVNTLHHSDADLPVSGQVGNYYWTPIQNSYDEDVASGVYIYCITAENNNKIGKIMIIR